MEIKSNVITEEVLSELKVRLKSLTLSDVLTKSVPPKMSVKKFEKYDRFLVNIYNNPSMSFESGSMNHSTLTNLFVPLEKSKPKVDKDCSKNNVPRNMTEFMMLRNKRDMECLKLKEASNIISYLTKCPDRFWTERLLAEKVLLESGKRVELLKTKISQRYVSCVHKDVQIGTITLSNFKFGFNETKMKRNETLYFVLVLSSDDEVKASKLQRGTGEIAFNESFTFSINRNFKIKVQLYCYIMKSESKFSQVLPWHTSQRCRTTKLQYKNLNTSKFEESSIIKTSFQPWAESEVVASNIHNKAWSLQALQNCRLEEFATFSAKMQNFKIECKRLGFATVGLRSKDTIVWNRRWCCLNGNLLSIFSSPNDEDLVPPQTVLNLAECLVDKIEQAPREICNRRNSIVIEVSDERYFLMFDDVDDLKNWITDLNVVLDALKFKKTYNL